MQAFVPSVGATELLMTMPYGTEVQVVFWIAPPDVKRTRVRCQATPQGRGSDPG